MLPKKSSVNNNKKKTLILEINNIKVLQKNLCNYI